MTKSGINFLTVAALLCGLAVGSRQTTGAAEDAEEAQSYRPITLGAEAGTPGLGGSASWRFSDHFGVRAGFNYFSFSSSGDEFVDVQFEILDPPNQNAVIGLAQIDTEMRLMSEPLGVDIFPWKKSSFRITVGIMLNQNEQTGEVPTDPVAGRTTIGINGTAYDLNSIGGLSMQLKQQPVSPYVSIGYSYFFGKAKHWSLSGELGVAYTGNPEVTLTTGNPGTVNPADLNAVAQEMQDNAWQFLPILRLGVNYSF